MRSQRSKNSRAKVRAAQIERAFLSDLYWLAFLVATSIIFLPMFAHAGDYQAHEAKLGKLDAQMKKTTEDIQALAKSKQHAVQAEQKENIHNQMMSLYKELKISSSDYQETVTHIRFKHPEKGDEIERKYSRQPLQPFSNFENDVTLDGKLDSFLHKMRTVYGETPKPKKQELKKADPRAPASAEKKPFNPDDVDQPITLKK